MGVSSFYISFYWMKSQTPWLQQNVDLYETHKRKEHKFVSLTDKNVASKPTNMHTYTYSYVYDKDNKSTHKSHMTIVAKLHILFFVLSLSQFICIYLYYYMEKAVFFIVWYWKNQIYKCWSQLLIFVHSNCCHRVYLTKGIRCNTMISSYITWI